MCRLYGFCATEPTKVECTLVHAQNALIAQSKSDQSGKSHAHGWGVVTYEDEKPHRERQAWAAYHGEHFERAASKIYAPLVVAHVRRATVGGPSLENTHPFTFNQWTFAHNGTVPHFDRLKPRFLEKIDPKLRKKIEGETDSEHLFYFALTKLENAECDNLTVLLTTLAQEVEDWVHDISPKAKLGLNVILTDGKMIAGSRLGRSLFYVQRQGIYDCEICGFPHIHHSPDRSHNALVVASEPITHEAWNEIPERSIWRADIKSGHIAISRF